MITIAAIRLDILVGGVGSPFGLLFLGSERAGDFDRRAGDFDRRAGDFDRAGDLREDDLDLGGISAGGVNGMEFCLVLRLRLLLRLLEVDLDFDRERVS